MYNFYKQADAESIKDSLIQWGLNATQLPQPQIERIVDQIIQEEQQLLDQGYFNGKDDKRYSMSLWAKKRFKELLGIQKQKA